MDPRTIRKWLTFAAAALAAASAIVAKLVVIDFTQPIYQVALAAVSAIIGVLAALPIEAPGGVPKWKIPEHLRQFIPK